MPKLFIIAAMLVGLAGCNSAEVRWEKARSENTVEAYRDYLKHYPDGRYVYAAQAEMEKLSFANARKRNTVSAYEEYLKEYPKGKNADIARAEMETLAFADAQRRDTIGAYEDYLKGYPEGKNADIARSKLDPMLFANAQKQNTPSVYAEYLKKFPKGKFHLQAKKGIIGTVKTAKLTVGQMIFGKPDESDKYNLKKGMVKLLELAGIRAVAEDSDKYEAAITVRTSASAGSQTYYYPGSPVGLGLKRYTAASFDLGFTLEMPDGSRFKDEFSGTRKAPETTSPDEYTSEGSAPVHLAYPDLMAGFVPFLANLFGAAPVLESFRFNSENVFGKITDPGCADLLLAALKFPRHIHGAVVGLGKIKEPQAVEPLCALLTDPNPPIGSPYIDPQWDEKREGEGEEKLYRKISKICRRGARSDRGPAQHRAAESGIQGVRAGARSMEISTMSLRCG